VDSAQAWLDDVLAVAGRCELPGMVRTGATVADAVAEWLRYAEHDRAVTRSTLTDYRHTGNRIARDLGEMRLEDVTSEVLERWRATLTSSNRTAASAPRRAARSARSRWSPTSLKGWRDWPAATRVCCRPCMDARHKVRPRPGDSDGQPSRRLRCSVERSVASRGRPTSDKRLELSADHHLHGGALRPTSST
jgi:hypothetical protein